MDDPGAVRAEADAILERSFGVRPERSTLTLHDTASWERLKTARKHRETDGSATLGLYLPHEAHVWRGNETWIATLYHELHGHGVYYERSRIAAWRHDDPLPPELAGWGLQGSQRRNSEGFATWMEEHLCRATGRDRLWRRVLARMPAAYRDAHECASELASRLTPNGFLRQMGLPARIDASAAAGILRAAGHSADLAVLVGDPGLDHPLRALVVSDARPHATGRPWLDVRVLSGEEFISGVVRRDSALADDLAQGTFLYGDEFAWGKARERLVPHHH